MARRLLERPLPMGAFSAGIAEAAQKPLHGDRGFEIQNYNEMTCGFGEQNRDFGQSAAKPPDHLAARKQTFRTSP